MPPSVVPLRLGLPEQADPLRRQEYVGVVDRSGHALSPHRDTAADQPSRGIYESRKTLELSSLFDTPEWSGVL